MLVEKAEVSPQCNGKKKEPGSSTSEESKWSVKNSHSSLHIQGSKLKTIPFFYSISFCLVLLIMIVEALVIKQDL